MTAVPAPRRHTLAFLEAARPAAPVHIGTDVDVGALSVHQQRADRKYSFVTYVAAALGEVLTRYPNANASYEGGLFPRTVANDSVDVKLAVDKSVDDVRIVASVILRDVGARSLASIQDDVDRARDTTADDLPELDGIRVLHRLPFPLARIAFGFATRLARRSDVLGTVSVTSLGHAPVTSFHSYGGTVVTIGLGRVTRRPVVRRGDDGTEIVAITPVLPLSLTFDHRAIDGAEAADVLAALVANLSSAPTS